MKRVLSIVLALALLICAVPVHANAAEVSDGSPVVTTYDDGSYTVTEIIDGNARATTGTKCKQTTKYNSDDEVEWIFRLYAVFSYDGTTSSCTMAYTTLVIQSDIWYEISRESSYSGATAYGSATLGKTLLGITISKPTYSLTLSCDKDGNLS